MTDTFRAELQRLVEAYDEHGGKWPDHHEQALFQAVKNARAALAQPEPVALARTEDEYHEDMGAVLWWRFPIDEPPYCGSPLDSEWPGYHTHFTPLGPMPTPANALEQLNDE